MTSSHALLVDDSLEALAFTHVMVIRMKREVGDDDRRDREENTEWSSNPFRSVAPFRWGRGIRNEFSLSLDRHEGTEKARDSAWPFA
jgi:hypothetical protein